MEEKLKSVNMHPSESESSLYRRYQELTRQIQEKDIIVKKLEAQLEKQVRSDTDLRETCISRNFKERDDLTFFTCP